MDQSESESESFSEAPANLRMGGVQKTVQLDVLCRFEVLDGKGNTYRKYAFITAASARSGTNKPSQVFVCLEPTDWNLEVYEQSVNLPFAGLIMDLQTLPYVEPQGSMRFPVQPCREGRLRMFTADQFAAFLLDLPVVYDPALEAVQVTAHLMHFRDILPRRIMVIGYDENLPDMIATPESAPAVAGDNSDSDGSGGAASQHDQGNGGQEHDETFDLLSFLQGSETCETNPRPKRRKTTNKNQTAQHFSVHSNSNATDPTDDSSKTVGDPILDDPCLRTFLSPQDIAALREARDVCNGKALEVHDWLGGDMMSSGESEGDIEDVQTLDENDVGKDTHTCAAQSESSNCKDSSGNRAAAASSDSWFVYSNYCYDGAGMGQCKAQKHSFVQT